MELDIKTKTTWILAGRIALGAVCMLVTVLSLSRLGSDEWRTLWEWLSTLARRSPLGFAIFVAGVVNLFLLFGLYLWGDKRTRRVLLPMCILLPLHLFSFMHITFLFPIVDLILLLVPIPCVIEAIARKKPLLGIAARFGRSTFSQGYIYAMISGRRSRTLPNDSLTIPSRLIHQPTQYR